MHQSFTDFLRHGGEGEFLLRKADTGVVGRRVGWSVKNSFPDYAALRQAFDLQLEAVASENAAMLLDALAGAYDPPLEDMDLPSIADATNEVLAEWDQRLAVIWGEWNTYPQRLRPLRQAMEERLLRGYAGLINEIRQRDLGIEQYVWLTVGDERVRAAHSERGGSVYRWDSGDEKPGEATNCRCSTRPVPPGAGVAALSSLGMLDRFLGGLDTDFSAGLGVASAIFWGSATRSVST